MVAVTHDDLAVCDDCAHLIANGELGDGDETRAALHVDRMAAVWDDQPRGVLGLVLACQSDPETGECPGDDRCADFATGTCDGCGTGLAGARHTAAYIA